MIEEMLKKDSKAYEKLNSWRRFDLTVCKFRYVIFLFFFNLDNLIILFPPKIKKKVNLKLIVRKFWNDK